jgi:hypothetical protein
MIVNLDSGMRFEIRRMPTIVPVTKFTIENLNKPKKIGIKKEAPKINKLTKRKKPRIRTNKQIVERWLKRKKCKRTRIMRKRRKRT